MNQEIFFVMLMDAGESVLISCHGELDMASANRFREAIDETFASDAKRVHVDCTSVTFVDSIGVRALIHASTELAARNIAMTLSPSPRMKRLLDAIGASKTLSLA